MARKCGVVAAAATAIALLICISGRAAAHAELVSSQAANGARLGLAPATVVLVFTESLSPALSHATVTDPSGRAVSAAPLSASEIRVGILTNLPGVYRVSWQVVSADDGHATRGSSSFTVESTSSAALTAGGASHGTVLDVVIAIARWIEDGALLLTFGMLYIAWVARRGPQLAWVRLRVLPPAVALAAGLVVIGGEAASASGVSLGGVTAYIVSGPAGAARVARVLAEALAYIAIASRSVAAWPAVLLALTALSASGHAAAARIPWLSVALDAGHLLAAGVWVGGIMAIAMLRPPGGWRGGGRALLTRFTPWALLGFATSVCLGVLQASINLGSPSALLTTSYGRLLIAKAAGVAALIPLSLLAWRQRRALPRVEAAIGIAVIGAAALLASLPVPARSGTIGGAALPLVATALPRGHELTLGGRAGQTLVGLTLDPASPGINEVTIYVASDAAVPHSVDVTAQINATTCRCVGAGVPAATPPSRCWAVRRSPSAWQAAWVARHISACRHCRRRTDRGCSPRRSAGCKACTVSPCTRP